MNKLTKKQIEEPIQPTPAQQEIILTAEKIRIFLANNELGRAPLTYQMAVWHLREIELLKNETITDKITEAKTI